MNSKLTSRQQEIIQAAGELLMKFGVTGFTTKQLAAKMGFSEAALYRHFKSKEDVLVAMISELREKFSHITQAEADKEQKSVDAIQSFFNSIFRFFADHPHYLVVILSDGILDSSEQIKKEITALMEFHMKHIGEMIVKGQQDGKIRTDVNKTSLTHVLMSSFRLMMLKWKLSSFKLDVEKEGNLLFIDVLQLITFSNETKK